MLRKLENLHILFWLFKDFAWCMHFPSVGIAMVIPTISIALWVIYITKEDHNALIHNISIFFWIAANSTWMVSEFFKFEKNFFGTGIPGLFIAGIFFSTGILILLAYYGFWAWKWLRERKAE